MTVAFPTPHGVIFGSTASGVGVAAKGVMVSDAVQTAFGVAWAVASLSLGFYFFIDGRLRDNRRKNTLADDDLRRERRFLDFEQRLKMTMMEAALGVNHARNDTAVVMASNALDAARAQLGATGPNSRAQNVVDAARIQLTSAENERDQAP